MSPYKEEQIKAIELYKVDPESQENFEILEDVFGAEEAERIACELDNSVELI